MLISDKVVGNNLLIYGRSSLVACVKNNYTFGTRTCYIKKIVHMSYSSCLGQLWYTPRRLATSSVAKERLEENNKEFRQNGGRKNFTDRQRKHVEKRKT